MTTPDISTKNTKNEILDAYHEVLQQLQETKKASKQEAKRKQEEQETLKSASAHTTQEIINQLANLKFSMVNAVEELGNQLLEEHKKLLTLQQAIGIQRQELEEIYEIKANTDTLAALLQAQKQKKENFEQEMEEEHQAFEQETSQQRLLWKKEREEAENLRKEQEMQQKKLKQREEDEYIYKRDLERQKEREVPVSTCKSKIFFHFLLPTGFILSALNSGEFMLALCRQIK